MLSEGDICGVRGYSGPDNDGGCILWDRRNFGGGGHIEIVVGERKTRAWLATGRGVWLIWEHDQGILCR